MRPIKLVWFYVLILDIHALAFILFLRFLVQAWNYSRMVRVI
jgi:hypothetical protein